MVIRVPWHTPLEEVERFFQGRLPWIRRKLGERKRREDARLSTRSFLPGEEFFCLGDRYPLVVDPAMDRYTGLVFRNGTFLLGPDRIAAARDEFVEWYKNKARVVLTEAVARWATGLGLSPGVVRITSARRRYGSCSPRNTLSFSWRLVMAPQPVVDYVVVHELMHLAHRNHSREFWQAVEKAMPDFKARRLWLKEHSHLLLP